jgi:hypothetical protein
MLEIRNESVADAMRSIGEFKRIIDRLREHQQEMSCLSCGKLLDTGDVLYHERCRPVDEP